ncbi:MAG: GFA family protein [Woeseiaceae bacterium]|jgi:hypothetical protein
MIYGHCECGKVSFEAAGPIEDFGHCHCSQCRRMHGAAFATFAGVRRSGFRYLSGEDVLSTYASSATYERVFCSVCGSNILGILTADPSAVYLCMGAIEGNPPRPEGYHIYVGSKAPWHEISDDLKQFDTQPAVWP